MCRVRLWVGEEGDGPSDILICEYNGNVGLHGVPYLALVSRELLQNPEPLRLEVREGEFVIHAQNATVTYRHRPEGWPPIPEASLFERVSIEHRVGERP